MNYYGDSKLLRHSIFIKENQRATTKGQNRLGTFSHFLAISTHFHTFSEFFRIFLQRGFTTVFVQRDEKTIKEKKEKKKKKKTKPFCTLVVACLSSTDFNTAGSFERAPK